MSEPARARGQTWRLRTINCPRCAEPLVFDTERATRIDACGFEIHCLDCGRCGAVLTGVLDPYDEALLF
jgi:hypothetical protein